MEQAVHLVEVRAVTDRLPHTLRSDARDNRDRILVAARTAFAADGIDVPMREIARRAGVGPATLYRRFPTKEALVTAAFVSAFAHTMDFAAARERALRSLAELTRVSSPAATAAASCPATADDRARDRRFDRLTAGVSAAARDFFLPLVDRSPGAGSCCC
ncbi:helix-turn-helix domain-containing protein [Kibdelosporangium persicum]